MLWSPTFKPPRTQEFSVKNYKIWDFLIKFELFLVLSIVFFYSPDSATLGSNVYISPSMKILASDNDHSTEAAEENRPPSLSSRGLLQIHDHGHSLSLCHSHSLSLSQSPCIFQIRSLFSKLFLKKRGLRAHRIHRSGRTSRVGRDRYRSCGQPGQPGQSGHLCGHNQNHVNRGNQGYQDKYHNHFNHRVLRFRTFLNSFHKNFLKKPLVVIIKWIKTPNNSNKV